MDARTELARLLNRCFPGDGIHESGLPGTQCVKASHPTRRARMYWHAALCIVAQGCKEIVLGREAFRFDDVHYIATPVDLPVVGRVAAASPEKPFLCLRIALDPLALSEVETHLDRNFSADLERSLRGVFVGSAGDRMLDAAVRLARLFETPEDVPVVGPLIVKEIFYHLLKGPDGPAVRQFIRSGSTMHRISQAVYTLKSGLSEAVDVRELAEAATMSRSAFFKHFKDVTSMSPIQYQKRLRLLEARRLMVDEGETAERSAFKVGYNSASQFSREYSRMFGSSPSRDARNIKETARRA